MNAAACPFAPARAAELALLRVAVAAGVGGSWPATGRRELAALLGGSRPAAALLVAMVALAPYGNAHRVAREDRAAWRLLRAQGLRRHAGRRPRVGMDLLVVDLVPVALAIGVPFGTGDNSRLVRLLRCVAEHAGVDGDPRGPLRRRMRLHEGARAAAKRVVCSAFAEALARR